MSKPASVAVCSETAIFRYSMETKPSVPCGMRVLLEDGEGGKDRKCNGRYRESGAVAGQSLADFTSARV
jgi:hypothetical protein